MIKVHIDADKEIGNVEISGTPFDVISEITYIISNVYSHYLAADKIIATAFQYTLQSLIVGDDSPVWEAKKVSKEGITMVTIRVPDKEA